MSSESTVLELVGLIYDAAGAALTRSTRSFWETAVEPQSHLGCRCSGKPGSFAERR